MRGILQRDGRVVGMALVLCVARLLDYLMPGVVFSREPDVMMSLGPLAALAIGVGGNILGNLFGGDKSEQSSSTNQTTNSTGTSTPTWDPRFGPLLRMLLGRTSSTLSRGSSLPPGFETNAAEEINAGFAGPRQNLEASLAARGLADSPIAGSALTNLEVARGAKLGDLGVQLPLLERQLSQEDLANALQVLGLGRGESTKSTARTVGTGTTTGSTQQSPTSGLGSLIGYLYGSGAFNRATT